MIEHQPKTTTLNPTPNPEPRPLVLSFLLLKTPLKGLTLNFPNEANLRKRVRGGDGGESQKCIFVFVWPVMFHTFTPVRELLELPRIWPNHTFPFLVNKGLKISPSPPVFCKKVGSVTQHLQGCSCLFSLPTCCQLL